MLLTSHVFNLQRTGSRENPSQWLLGQLPRRNTQTTNSRGCTQGEWVWKAGEWGASPARGGGTARASVLFLFGE